MALAVSALPLLTGCGAGAYSAITGGISRGDRLGLVHLRAATFVAYENARVGSQIYYVLVPRGASSGRSECFGAGPAVHAGLVGTFVCGGGFPSVARPLLDESVVEVSGANLAPRVLRIRGFAVNGVRTVRFLGTRARIVVSLPVRNNVYADEPGSPFTATSVQAIDGDGRVIYTHHF